MNKFHYADSALYNTAKNLLTTIREDLTSVKAKVNGVKVGDNTNFGKVLAISADSVTFKAKDTPKTTIKLNQRKVGSPEFVLDSLKKITEGSMKGSHNSWDEFNAADVAAKLIAKNPVKDYEVEDLVNFLDRFAYANNITGSLKDTDFLNELVKILKAKGYKDASVETLGESTTSAGVTDAINEMAFNQMKDNELIIWLGKNWTNASLGKLHKIQLDTAAQEAKRRKLHIKGITDMEESTMIEGAPEDIAALVAKVKVGDQTNFGVVLAISNDSITFKAKDLPKTTIKFNQRKIGSPDYTLSKLTKMNESPNPAEQEDTGVIEGVQDTHLEEAARPLDEDETDSIKAVAKAFGMSDQFQTIVNGINASTNRDLTNFLLAIVTELDANPQILRPLVKSLKENDETIKEALNADELSIIRNLNGIRRRVDELDELLDDNKSFVKLLRKVKGKAFDEDLKKVQIPYKQFSKSFELFDMDLEMEVRGMEESTTLDEGVSYSKDSRVNKIIAMINDFDADETGVFFTDLAKYYEGEAENDPDFRPIAASVESCRLTWKRLFM